MAQLDPSIILSGQPVNMLGILDASNRMAGEQNDRLHQQQYRNMLATNGAGIMSGDQNALNALAGYDPAAALDIQSTRQEMDFSKRKMGILDAQERREAEEYARGLTADQRAAEAQQIEDAVKMGLMIPDAATWDQTMATMAPDLVGQFDNRQALAARYMSMAEVLKQAFPEPVDPTKGAPAGYMWNQPGQPGAGVSRIPGMEAEGNFRQATPQEAAAYGATGGQFGPDGRFYPVNPPSGMSVETGPEGQLRIVQGPGAGGSKPFTEGQSKDNVYVTRAEGALAVFDPVSEALTSRGEHLAEMVPLGLGRGAQSDQFQVAKQAGEEFLQAILRKDTGAAITSQEQELYGKTYLPQPGDGPAVLEAKRASRARAVEAMKAGMSAEQVAVAERALVEAARRTDAGGAAGVTGPDVPGGPVRKRYNPETGRFE